MTSSEACVISQCIGTQSEQGVRTPGRSLDFQQSKNSAMTKEVERGAA
jgi:hypothetical protein